ncbi:SRPBCC family protein [Moheibacter lacus]|uniref:SRPBCC family protein n=1 Tax=Moheibacter lacus TaxID=2745851 RepID=A0A838ZU79_9FLAO|nr:SRPBCC family protein [Moheibacter lacus]MBA5630527.1 SRPBCC family protein [Moheibacter lacus]
MKHELYREQQLNCDLQTAWDFFSSPMNLPKITPKNMAFTVLSEQKTNTIFEGMIIDYTVSPLFGIPLKWKTRITEVIPNKSFTDFQEKGPYKLWNHHHEFIPNEKGVFMIDKVDYELPFGVLGNIAHALFVKKKLEKIFNYRFHVLENLFNKN